MRLNFRFVLSPRVGGVVFLHSIPGSNKKQDPDEKYKTYIMKVKARLFQSLKIWMVIYPSITFFLWVFGSQLSVLPLYQRTFLLTISLVPWLVFFGVPLVDFLFRKFGLNRTGHNG
jgi:antibiotic biosynthesis monooxygenase (ABM) superfamily enzyme